VRKSISYRSICGLNDIFIDSEVDSWPLMASPVWWIIIFTFYLWIVYKAGPKFMEKRKAFKLKTLIRVYNLYQILACLYFIRQFLNFELSFNLLWECAASPSGAEKLTEYFLLGYQSIWWFILLRASEFFETIVFVLRKKQNQVSILHVYHHIAVVALLWSYLKFSGGFSETVIATTNSVVHVLMYSYYFFSSFNVLKKATTKIKPLITGLQIVQLFVLFFHCCIIIARCQVTKLYYLQAGNLGFLVFMFLKFYFESYIKKNKKVA
jgi:elongation of very long chain fatty acids protein 1